MKAFRVGIPGEWCTLVHAETRGKAIAWTRSNINDWPEFTEFRAVRVPGLDDIAITYKNALNAGFEYTYDEITENELDLESMFVNYCNCNICAKVTQ